MSFYYDYSFNLGAEFTTAVAIKNIDLLPIPNKKKEVQKPIIKKVNEILKKKKEITDIRCYSFKDVNTKYTSSEGLTLDNILKDNSFINKIYSGRASKIRNFSVNINTNIIIIYLDKSGSEKYEILKFEENDKYKRKYIKYYLENLTDEQLAEIGEKYNGNILKKTLQIEIPDYNKDHVVKKVVKEWESLQQEIENSEYEIKRLDNEIDQMVYKLYDLNEEEIEIVENN